MNQAKTVGHKLSGSGFIGLIVFLFFLAGCEISEDVSKNMITTSAIINITETKANGGGFVYNGGRATVDMRGICWDTQPLPTIRNNRTMNGSGDGTFFSTLTNLTPNTTYYVRGYATNKEGTSYGNEVIFTTRFSQLPILSTNSAYNRTSNSCYSGGTIEFGGRSEISSRGVCWSETNPPTITDSKTVNGSGNGSFNSFISGLNPFSAYYVRAYATNNEGTGYGDVLYLKPYTNSVTDIDGNIYKTVVIGTQVWTVENLNVTRYQNGDPISNIQDNALWNTTTSGAHCEYDNELNNTETYGRLYNWYAASDSRNIAPKGWHVATYEDYLILIDFLGGPFEAEEKLINEGFKALPGGKRNRDGLFFDLGLFPYFWTSTEYHEGSLWARYLSLNGDLNIVTLSKNYGFSVRCVRD